VLCLHQGAPLPPSSVAHLTTPKAAIANATLPAARESLREPRQSRACHWNSAMPGRLAEYLTRMDFVVLDELGYLPFSQAGGQLLFHLMSRLYERTSIRDPFKPLALYPLNPHSERGPAHAQTLAQKSHALFREPIKRICDPRTSACCDFDIFIPAV
jgi:hypothetical protein